MTRRPLVTAITLLIALPATLTACADPGTTPLPAPLPAASASASPSPLPPEPTFDRVALECDDIAEEHELSAIVGAALDARDPLATNAAAAGMIPRLANVLAAGGLVCEWSNGVSSSPILGTPLEYVGMEVQIAPATAESWEYFESWYGLGTQHELCHDRGCSLDYFHNGYWTSVVVHGRVDAALAMERMRQVPSLVAVLPAPEPYSAPESEVTLAALPCTDYFRPGEVEAILGSPTPLEIMGGGGGWSLYGHASATVGSHGCSFLGAPAPLQASIEALPGGSTVGNAFLSVATAPSEPTSLTIPGSDRSTIRCSEGDAECIVDMMIAGHWLQARTAPNGQHQPSEVLDGRAVALELASLLAQRARVGV